MQCISRSGCSFSPLSECRLAGDDGDISAALSADGCPGPEIVSISPSSGPLSGRTQIEINGTNFGISKSEVKVKLISLPVSDPPSSSDCAITDYTIAERIVCQIEKVEQAANYSIQVEVRDKKSKQSELAVFEYIDPVLTRIAPMGGVAAGGTVLTLSGQNLDIGRDRQIQIGSELYCAILSTNSTTVTCKTPEQTPGRQPVTIKIDQYSFPQAEGTEQFFEIFSNPEMKDVRFEYGSATWLGINKTIPAFCCGGSSIIVKLEWVSSRKEELKQLWVGGSKFFERSKVIS